VDDGVKKCLVGHYLALQEDVFNLGQISQAEDIGHHSVRVRTVEEINDGIADLGKSSKMLEVDAFWASRLLLEVTHDMLVDVASDILEEKTVDELKTCEGLSASHDSPYFLSMSSSGADCLETDRDKCQGSDEQSSLKKLLQVKHSIITQIEKLSSKVESSPPSAYKRRNCEQLEPVSSEEGEWTPVKKITSLKINSCCSSSQKKVSMMETVIDKEAFDKVSSDDNMDCQSPSVPKDIQSGILSANEASSSRKRKRKIKKRRKPMKGERLRVKEAFDEVSSNDNLDCQSHPVPNEVVVLQKGIMRTNEASSRKRKRNRKNKRKRVNDGLQESLDNVSSDDNLDDFYNPSLSEDGELVNSSD
jgi:hypothetical protein